MVQDYDLAGNWKEIIDEFPFFSFLLADLHPHVLAMPFAFLAMALALNIFLGGGSGAIRLASIAAKFELVFLRTCSTCIGWTGVSQHVGFSDLCGFIQWSICTSYAQQRNLVHRLFSRFGSKISSVWHWR